MELDRLSRFLLSRALPIALAVSAVLLVAGGDRSDALEQPLAITVRPRILLSRGDVRVELRVPRDVDNRLLVLAWDGGTAGESRWQIDGDDSPALFVRELPSMPAAHYVFAAALFGRAGERRGTARAEILTGDTR